MAFRDRVILVVCALAAELPGIDARPNVRLLEAGVGPVEAALATARALATNGYDLVVSAGIAGGFAERSRIGDSVAVVSERFVGLGREDGSPLALPGGRSPRCESTADRGLVARAIAKGLRPVRGATVATVTTNDDTAQRIRDVLDVEIETMEGFAVFRAAEAACVPAIGIRGISNRVGNAARAGWDFPAGAAAASRGLIRFLESFNDAHA